MFGFPRRECARSLFFVFFFPSSWKIVTPVQSAGVQFISAEEEGKIPEIGGTGIWSDVIRKGEEHVKCKYAVEKSGLICWFFPTIRAVWFCPKFILFPSSFFVTHICEIPPQSVYSRQQKQVNTIVRYISYSVIPFFLPSQNAWVSAFEYRPGLSHGFQVSAEAEIYNPITVLGSCCIFSFCFPKWIWTHIFPALTLARGITSRQRTCIAFINPPRLTVIWSKFDLGLLVLIAGASGMIWKHRGLSLNP